MTGGRLALSLLLAATPAASFEPSVPPASRLTVERPSDRDVYAAPVGPFAEGTVPVVRLEGRVDRRAWRVPTPGLTPLQVLAPLRAQIEAEGFDIALDCDSRASQSDGF